MSLEACPHCHEQVHKSEDGCGTEKCMARRAFIRQAAIAHFAAQVPAGFIDEPFAWREAINLWNHRPEGC